MSTHLFLAPAAGGKTAHAVQAIRALPPLSPVCVLVPDQVQVQAFRRRLAQAGGALGIRLYTFYGLYADILASVGPHTPAQAGPGWSMARLPPTLHHRLILHLLGALCAAGRLSYYAPLCASAGFARLLAALFGELKRGRVWPDALQAATAHHEPRLAELAHIYAAYQAWLIETGWVDAEGQGWLAAIALEEHPPLLADLALLVVDGFDEFNPTQLEVLRLLAGRAAETLVTLTGDLARPQRLAHRRPARALAALVEALQLTPERLPSSSPSSTALAHLETHLFEPGSLSWGAQSPVSSSLVEDDHGSLASSKPGTSNLEPETISVEFVEAQNRVTEAREALRWLKARIVRDGVPPAETALVARDVTPYRPFLEEAAGEFGLPLRFLSGLELRTNPAAAALLTLLSLSFEPDSWPPRALLDVLRSPYFDWSAYGLRAADVERLADVARDGQVVAGLDQWRETFRRSAARAAQEPWAVETPASLDEEGLLPRPAPSGPEAARLEAAFEKIVTRLTPPANAALREHVAWVEDLVGEDPALARGVGGVRDDLSLHVVACARQALATAGRDVAALRAVKDILRGLLLAGSVLAPAAAAVSYERFVAELAQAIEGASYTVPVEGEAILAVSALEARGLSFDSLALLGLAEGEFPRAEREDALLREADRAWLRESGFAVEPRLRGDETTLFYQAVTRARRRLLLSRPYLADDGQAWEASPYWSSVRALFAHAPLRRVRSTDLVFDLASEQELASLAGSERAERARAVLAARARACAAPSPWSGDLSAIAPRLDERFGPGQAWSSSRLETYAKCPFYFWAAYAMALKPRELPKAGYDVLILGSMYHLVLERLYRRVPDGDSERLRAELPAVAREVYAAAPNDYGFRPTPVWERQQEELTAVLGRTLEALIEVAGDYKPFRQELPFGLDGQPMLVLQDGDGHQPLHLRGYIDRVDRAPDGRLRIIDYKAGSSPIAVRELQEGRRLQLPLYALAAQQALGAEVASAFYWHISSAQPSRLQLERYPGGVAGAIEEAAGYALPIASRVRGGHMPPSPPDEGCPAFCPAAAFCERYKP